MIKFERKGKKNLGKIILLSIFTNPSIELSLASLKYHNLFVKIILQQIRLISKS